MSQPRKFTLFGQVPAKKNSRIVTCRGARPWSFPSKQYQKWHKDALKQLAQARVRPVDEVFFLSCVFYHVDRRKRDLSNEFESVADLLRDSGIIPDDNCFVLGEIHAKFGGVDKENARVEISLASLSLYDKL